MAGKLFMEETLTDLRDAGDIWGGNLIHVWKKEIRAI